MRITPNMPAMTGYQTNWSLVWLDAKKRKNIMEKSFSFGRYLWWQGFCLGYHMVLSFLGIASIRTPSVNHGGDVQVIFFVDTGEASSLAEGFLWAPPLVVKATLAAAGFTEQIRSAPPGRGLHEFWALPALKIKMWFATTEGSKLAIAVWYGD